MTYIFTDADLDGAGAYLLYCWITNTTDVPYQVCRVNDLKAKIKAFSRNNLFDKYEKVCFFDFDVSDPEIVEMIDKDNVLIVDHHKSNIESDVQYEHAQVNIQDGTSTCRLLYKMYEQECVEFSPEQKLMVALIDDYDSYELKSPLSKQLNTVFWNYQGDRVQKLIRDYPTGFTGFNKFHKNIITIQESKLKKLQDSLDIFTGNIKTKKYNINFASAVATTMINDVADFICEKTGLAVAIVVNPKSGKVSFRRRKGDDSISMVRLASVLTDESGGHESAAGGLLCDKFLEFTKTLKPFV